MFLLEHDYHFTYSQNKQPEEKVDMNKVRIFFSMFFAGLHLIGLHSTEVSFLFT